MLALRAAALASPVPSGIDGGNWLAFGTFERPGIAYPPLVPWLLAGLTSVAGLATGTTVAAVLALSVPALVLLALALWSRRPIPGVIAALAVAGSGALGEVVAWGGYPQVIAIGTAVGALAALAAFCEGGARRSLMAFWLLFAVTAATSHLEAVPGLAAAALVTAWYMFSVGRPILRRAVLIAMAVAVPMLILAPTYLALIATLGVVPPSPADPARILGPGWPAYLAALAAGPAGLAVVMLRRRAGHPPLERRAHALLVAAAAASVAWAVAFLASGEARLLYDVAVIVPFSLVALWPLLEGALRNHRAALPAGLAAFAAAAVVAGTGLNAFPDQVAYYRVMTPDSLAAMRWLARVPSLQDGDIAVADVRGVPLGWWTEGIVHHEVLFAADLRWLRFPSERTRARRANALLYASGFPAGASASTAEVDGVHFVLLPQASAFGVFATSPPRAWRVVFASGNALVLAPDATTARS
jgi:hypothetical protein